MLRDKKFWLGLVVSVFFLILALVLYFAGVAVRTVRWQILLRPILPKTSLRKLYEVVVIGYMANDVLPARLGEVVRAFVLNRRTGVTKSAILGTIVVERIFDGITMVGFIAVSALFITLNATLDDLLKLGSILFLIVLAGFIYLALSPA